MTVNATMVSVLIPMYNVERFIERCLNSVFNQTYQSIEIIIVDDGSTDRSITIAKELIEKTCRRDYCKLIVHKKNGGLALARKTAIELSTGKYLFFLDSDDYWDNNHFVDDCIKKATKDNSLILVTDYIADYPKKQVYYSQYFPEKSGKSWAHALLQGKIQGFLCNKCFESNHYKRYALKHKEGQNLLEDVRSLFPLFLQTERVDYLSIPSIHYEQKNESSYIATVKVDNIKQIFSAIDDCKEYTDSLLGSPSEFDSDFEIAYLNGLKIIYDKASYNQYKTIRKYRSLNIESISLMPYHPLILYRFRCQLSHYSFVRYWGYLLCRIEKIIKNRIRA